MASEPERDCSMFHEWHDLLFLHWEVSAEILQAKLPPGLTVDTFEGKAYIGLIPFRISGIRANHFPCVPGFDAFPEINVRTYVHHQGKNPGIWFFSLDAANVFACIGARRSYKLPYYFAEITQTEDDSSSLPQTLYRSRRYFPGPLPAYGFIDYTVGPGQTRVADPGTFDHFFVERYLLYSYFNSRLHFGQVHHAPYPLSDVRVNNVDENLIAAAGVRRPNLAPISLFSPGVAVKVYSLYPV
jgi:uncharacterized protein YqjF (DUF2071 family)